MLFPGYVFNLFGVNYLDVAVWRFKYYYFYFAFVKELGFFKGNFWLLEASWILYAMPNLTLYRIILEITIYLFVVWPCHNVSIDFQSLQLTR